MQSLSVTVTGSDLQYLASERTSGHVTGQGIEINGGHHMP
jgi:hypothetical protein